MAKLDIAEKRLPQDGRIFFDSEGHKFDIRVSVLPTLHGEKIVLRLLNNDGASIDLERLGFTTDQLEDYREGIKKPHGIILISGPTGSGKTTTLYATLKILNKVGSNIITIEDPVEYHLKGITQTQINIERAYTFPEGLHSALRQDPDVIMVGEIRDGETAEIAVQAALTGHMVFSTLHTNNSAGVIPRLIDLGVNPKILVSALSVSLAQRLVRKLCSVCKKEIPSTPKETATIKSIIAGMKAEGKDISIYKIEDAESFKLFTAPGCDKCNSTGYKGRIGIFEAIRTDEAIEKIMPENPSEREIKKVASTQGILSMRQDGLVKMLNGVTSFEEVLSVVDLNEE
jgi:type II secretory ATPase GspE/PulE/Tfp pilus assembly ATPase PilB-like protein